MAPADEMAAVLRLHAAGDDRFRFDPVPNGLLRLYGGQLTAQALLAAGRTAPDRAAHSCHAYFGAPGRVDRPVDVQVVRDRDGRSFSTRRATATQDGQVVLTLAASFQVAEPGGRYGATMPPRLPSPETLPGLDDLARALGERFPERHRPVWWRAGPVDWRPVEPLRFVDPAEAGPQHFWFRLRAPIGPDPALHRAMLVYASDIHILHAAMSPFDEPVGSDLWQTSSLDHAVWFHDDARVDEWLLYRVEPVAAGGARALGRGTIFAEDGRHVATVMQEGLARPLDMPRLGRL